MQPAPPPQPLQLVEEAGPVAQVLFRHRVELFELESDDRRAEECAEVGCTRGLIDGCEPVLQAVGGVRERDALMVTGDGGDAGSSQRVDDGPCVWAASNDDRAVTGANGAPRAVFVDAT